MSTSMIWIRVLDMRTKSGRRTGHSPWQVTRFGSKLIAFLKEWIRKKENEIPKYLTGIK